jgi:hypothetical protein
MNGSDIDLAFCGGVHAIVSFIIEGETLAVFSPAYWAHDACI